MRGSVHLSSLPFGVQNSWIVKSSSEILIKPNYSGWDLRFHSPRYIYSHGDLNLVLAFLFMAQITWLFVHVYLYMFIFCGCLWKSEVTLSCSPLGGVHSFCLETGSLTRTWGRGLAWAAGQWAPGVCCFCYPGARVLGAYNHTQCFHGCQGLNPGPHACVPSAFWAMFPSGMVLDAHY